ncbi:unnamed protein product [Nezara viridula]|uniref:Uncharacterized protein n=1 Tax=Nezara viridula TaxID=85310 RepID=A0A9P0E431_NEZVI|nr:unnamed protein product [Nezara viridula]
MYGLCYFMNIISYHFILEESVIIKSCHFFSSSLAYIFF